MNVGDLVKNKFDNSIGIIIQALAREDYQFCIVRYGDHICINHLSSLELL
jgi:hypothetical protein